MKVHSVKTVLATAAAFGLATANPAFASAAIRSADALPVKTAAAASVPYSAGLENSWQCAQVDSSALNLSNQYARVDSSGNVVVDAQGAPYRCAAPASSYAVGGGFPFIIVAGMLGIGGLITALAGDDNDSPG